MDTISIWGDQMAGFAFPAVWASGSDWTTFHRSRWGGFDKASLKLRRSPDGSANTGSLVVMRP